MNSSTNHISKHSRNYNFTNFVVPFIENNYISLSKLNKFKDIKIITGASNKLNNETINGFIDKMILTKNDISQINLYFSSFSVKTTIHQNQLCVNAECIKNLPFNEKNIEEIFMEKNFNDFDTNIRKGALSLTTCHTIRADLNDGCNYNISIASAFYGGSPLMMGRLVLFLLQSEIDAFTLNLEDDKMRLQTEIIYTNAILGADYMDPCYNKYGTKTFGTKFYTNAMGFKGCNECLPQKVVYFFIDLYNEERYTFLYDKWKKIQPKNYTFSDFYQSNNSSTDYPPHDAIIMSDTPTTHDPIFNRKLTGTELRIYNAHRLLRVAGMYFEGKIYASSDSISTKNEYFSVIKKKMELYKKIINELIECLKIKREGRGGTLSYGIYVSDIQNITKITNQNPQNIVDMINIYYMKYIYTQPDIKNDSDIIKYLKKGDNLNIFLTEVYPRRKEEYNDICRTLEAFCKEQKIYAAQWGGDEIYYHKYLKYKKKYLQLQNKIK